MQGNLPATCWQPAKSATRLSSKRLTAITVEAARLVAPTMACVSILLPALLLSFVHVPARGSPSKTGPCQKRGLAVGEEPRNLEHRPRRSRLCPDQRRGGKVQGRALRILVKAAQKAVGVLSGLVVALCIVSLHRRGIHSDIRYVRCTFDVVHQQASLLSMGKSISKTEDDG